MVRRHFLVTYPRLRAPPPSLGISSSSAFTQVPGSPSLLQRQSPLRTAPAALASMADPKPSSTYLTCHTGHGWTDHSSTHIGHCANTPPEWVVQLHSCETWIGCCIRHRALLLTRAHHFRSPLQGQAGSPPAGLPNPEPTPFQAPPTAQHEFSATASARTALPQT